MVDYSRTRFNRLAFHKAQDAYIARLNAKRYFYVNGWVVPKLVYDALRRDLGCVLLCRGVGLLRKHCRTMLAGFLLGGDLIASGLEIDCFPRSSALAGTGGHDF